MRLLIYNAFIFERPDASAMFCENGVIRAFLSDSEARTCKSDRALNAKGNLLLPSFFDSHLHLTEYGLRLNRLDLNGKNLSQSLNIISDKVAQTAEGHWILGGGWMRNYFREFPTAKQLDAISTQHFIALQSHDYHAVWCNSKVLNALNAQDFSADELPKSESGQWLGLAKERAAIAVMKLPKISVAEKAAAVLFAQKHLFQFGITDVMSIEDHLALAAYKALGNQLKLRVHIAAYLESLHEAKAFFQSYSHPNLSLDAVKIFIDGSLGAETCSMLDAFDKTTNFGIDLYADSDLLQILKLVERDNLSICIHAIGDKAVRRALNVFEKKRDVRRMRRIEHAQLIDDQDVYRFASLGVIASMQPIHIKEDIQTAIRLIPSRQHKLFRFQSLLNSGATLVFGSDAPIETPNVFESLYYAIERRGKDGRYWFESERISLAEALRAYLETPHRLLQLNRRGRLEIGYEANAILIPPYLFEYPERLLNQQQVLATISAGEVVYADF